MLAQVERGRNLTVPNVENRTKVHRNVVFFVLKAIVVYTSLLVRVFSKQTLFFVSITCVVNMSTGGPPIMITYVSF